MKKRSNTIVLVHNDLSIKMEKEIKNILRKGRCDKARRYKPVKSIEPSIQFLTIYLSLSSLLHLKHIQQKA